MTRLSEDIQEIIRAAQESGLEVEIYTESGGMVEASGLGIGAGAVASGSDLSSDFTGQPATVDVGGAVASGGAFTRVLKADGFTIPAGPSVYLIVPGVAILMAAAFAAYRARIGLALVGGALGAGLIGGAFYPPLFALALVGLSIGAVLYFRGDLNKAAIEQAFVRTAAIIETETPDLKSKIKATTPTRARSAAGKLLKREGVS